jgi:glycosyltransferase involved in cell wall biosynthesis
VTRPWILVSGDFVPTGGMDAALLGLAQYLAGRGPLTLVCHRADPSLAALGARVISVPRPAGKHLLGMPLLDRAGGRAAASEPGAIALANGGNCRLSNQVNWLHYVHAAFEPVAGGGRFRRSLLAYKHRYFCRGERRAVRDSRLVIANSELTKRHAVEYLGVLPERCRVVYYGTDPERFAAVTDDERRAARIELGWSDRPHALYIGSLGDRRKGFDILYDAWKIACQSPKFDANLAVVGRGVEAPHWQARAASDGLSNRITFLGFRSDVPRILAAADVLVHPARYEAYGLGVHEALCRGIPAIVTANAGVAERLTDLEDLVVPAGTTPALLAERLQHWYLQSDAFAPRLKPFADRLRARTWENMAEEIVGLAS